MTLQTTTTTVTLGGGSPIGIGGSAASLVGFYGAAPVVQPTKAVAVTTTGSSSTTNAYAYTTAAQADAIVTAVNALITNDTTLGLAA